jgi:hypothetical protein
VLSEKAVVRATEPVPVKSVASSMALNASEVRIVDVSPPKIEPQPVPEHIDYTVLDNMLALLPKDGYWKPGQRTHWLRAFTNLLDVLTADPPCGDGGHHACEHFRRLSSSALDMTRDSDYCSGCGATRPGWQDQEGKWKSGEYRHEPGCAAVAVTGEPIP